MNSDTSPSYQEEPRTTNFLYDSHSSSTHSTYTMVSQDWQALIDQKRAQREASIPSKWRIPGHVADKVSPTASVSAFELLEETDILSKEEREITDLHDATALLELLA